MKNRIESNTFYWALTGIFGALHLVLTMIPLFVLSSGSGFISMGLVSSVAIGFILGPFYGAVSVLMGSVLGVFIFNVGGILGPIIPVVAPVTGALIAGCLKTKQPQIVLAIYIFGLAAFLVSPIGFIATIYIWMHIIATMLVLLFMYPKSSEWLKRRIDYKSEKNVRPILIICFIALLGDSLIGGALAAYWLTLIAGFDVSLVTSWFVGATILYPLERIAVTIVVTGVLIALGRALTGTQLEVLLDNTPRSIHLEMLHGDEAS